MLSAPWPWSAASLLPAALAPPEAPSRMNGVMNPPTTSTKSNTFHFQCLPVTYRQGLLPSAAIFTRHSRVNTQRIAASRSSQMLCVSAEMSYVCTPTSAPAATIMKRMTPLNHRERSICSATLAMRV